MKFFQLIPPKQEPTTKSRQLFVSSSAPTAASSSSRQIHKTWQRVQLLYNLMFFFRHKTSSAIHQHAGASAAFSSATHTWSSDNTSKIIRKKGMLSLTEDGKPGGTFRTFFVWTSEREKKSNKTIHEGLTGQVAFISFKRRFWFYLFEFNRSP